jgi:glycosyltransferase involved in cell wall biosynthesis
MRMAPVARLKKRNRGVHLMGQVSIAVSAAIGAGGTVVSSVKRGSGARIRAKDGVPPEMITAYLGSYPPRVCGIATFTRNLSTAVARSERGIATRVAAITNEGALYHYPPQVRWTIDQNDPRSWTEAAIQVNRSAVSLVSIQHEFGIYGRFERDGRFVDMLGHFLDLIERPIVTTLHTVSPHPPDDRKEAIKRLHDRSAAVVTMVNMANLILEQEYRLDAGKLFTIPHGVPEVRWAPPEK